MVRLFISWLISRRSTIFLGKWASIQRGFTCSGSIRLEVVTICLLHLHHSLLVIHLQEEEEAEVAEDVGFYLNIRFPSTISTSVSSLWSATPSILPFSCTFLSINGSKSSSSTSCCCSSLSSSWAKRWPSWVDLSPSNREARRSSISRWTNGYEPKCVGVSSYNRSSDSASTSWQPSCASSSGGQDSFNFIRPGCPLRATEESERLTVN